MEEVEVGPGWCLCGSPTNKDDSCIWGLDCRDEYERQFPPGSGAPSHDLFLRRQVLAAANKKPPDLKPRVIKETALSSVRERDDEPF